MARLRIGLDIDSCIGATDESWSAYIKSQDGKCHSATEGFDYDAKPDGWSYWNDICPECFDHVLHDRERIMEISLKPHAFSTIRNLSEEADLWIVTSRPESVHKHTIAWVERNGLYDLVQDVIFSHEKEKVCEELALDYHLDDSPRHISAIRENSKTAPVIFDTLYNRDEKGIRIKGWDEFYELMRAVITVNMYAA